MSDLMADERVMPTTYLGDAVYASFDGYQIWLHLNDHRNPGLIALEPSVYRALVEYGKRIWRRNEQPSND